MSGPVAISRDGSRFAVAISQADPRTGKQTDHVVVGRTGSSFRGVTVLAGATIAPGHEQVAPQWTRSGALVVADPSHRDLLVLDPGSDTFRRLDLRLPEFAAVLAY